MIAMHLSDGELSAAGFSTITSGRRCVSDHERSRVFARRVSGHRASGALPAASWGAGTFSRAKDELIAANPGYFLHIGALQVTSFQTLIVQVTQSDLRMATY